MKDPSEISGAWFASLDADTDRRLLGMQSSPTFVAAEVYRLSDGDLTRRFYAELETRGPRGLVAMNLFRAQKCSSRAKLYRRRVHKSAAYDRKDWSLGLLVEVLNRHAGELGIVFGWALDPDQPFHSWVLYVDLPGIGQVSYHTARRGVGPDYAGAWDGLRLSAERVCRFCDEVLREGSVT